jgi:uncharacterized protein YhaN
MRIRNLGLRRYGKFTDAAIDFGERPAGVPDLHIVYGPNEAGKSTAMSACMDLLYGIPHQSRFNFLHPYQAMRIEAELDILGTARSFSRIIRHHTNEHIVSQSAKRWTEIRSRLELNADADLSDLH